jgi:hypothetical protein
MLVLAANDGTNGIALALNSTRVFWPRYLSTGNEIWSVSKNGGDPVRVSSGYALALVADDSYLYWTDGGNLYSTPVGGGQVALLFSGSSIGKLVLDETGALYWTVENRSTSSSSSVHRMQSRQDTVLASGVTPSGGGIAVDATDVYFTDYGTQGSIRRVPRTGGNVETVYACGSTCFPQAVRVDSKFVYFRTVWSGYPAQSGEVQALGKKDSKVVTLSGGNGNGGYMYNLDLEVNASVVYWNWNGGASPYGIFRANADGPGFTALATSGDTSWNGLRVDDLAVYYWHMGALIRLLK